MKTKKCCKSAISLLLSFVMIFAVMVPMASAVSVDNTKLGDDTYLTSKTDYVLAPGITESKITTNNSTGTNQNVSYAVEVDMSNPTTSVIASYKDYDGSKLGFQKVRDQAYAAESKRDVNVVAGTNADFFNMQTGETYGALVMNGTTYHAASGRPYFGITKDGNAVIRTGKLKSDIVEAVGGLCLLVKNGEITEDALTSDYNTYTAPRTAVGITAEGNVILYVVDGRQAPYSTGHYFDELAAALIALGCETALCLDGGGSSTYISQHEGETDLVCRNSPSDGSERTVSSSLLICSTAKPSGVFDHASLAPNNEIYTPGSSVQFTATGVDSAGYSADLPESGTFALADETTGTIDATTGLFTAAEDYTGEVTVNYIVNSEVAGSTTIEIVIPDELYVANTEQAVGPGITTDFGIVAKYQNRDVTMKSDDIQWSIIEQQEENTCYAYFYKDQFDEKYLDASTYGTYSSGTKNKVEVTQLNWSDEYVILKIRALNPTKGTKYTIDWLMTNKIETATGIYQVTKAGDLNGVAGTFEGLTFTGAEENAFNATVSATLKCNPELTLDLTVFVGSRQISLYDFEYTTDAEEAAVSDSLTYIPSYELPTYGSVYLNSIGESNASISAQLNEDGIPLYMWPNANIADNNSAKATVVSAADGEPVRFGDHSLKIHFDYSSYTFTKNANFYLRATTPLYAFEGSPTAIGCWVYIPEGTSPYHLYLNCTCGVDMENADWYSSNCYISVGQATWTGWQYVEFDLTGLSGGNYVGGSYEPYGLSPGGGIFWVSYQPSSMGTDTSEDTIYIDDMVLIYGANTSDTINPEINYVGTLTENMVDGETVYTSNTVTFKAQYADIEDKYMTGIDDTATKMYIDGVDVTDNCYINEGDDEIYFYDTYLANGTHCIEIEVSDVFGNKTTETRYFTVEGEDSNTEFDFVEVDGSPILGETYSMVVVTNNIDDIESASIEVKVLSNFTRYWNSFNIVAADGFELDGEPVFNETLSTINFNVKKSETAAASESLDNAIVYVNVNIPTDVPEGLEATYRISKGSVEFVSEKNENYVKGFSGKITTTCISPFTVEIDAMVVGSEGSYMTVVDTKGDAVNEANIYTTDGTLLGVTDENGKIFVNNFVNEIVKFTVYAEKNGQISFEYSSQSLLAGGDKNGKPTNIILNAADDGSTQQNISWMSSPLASGNTAVVKYATKADYEANGADAFETFTGVSYLEAINTSGNISTNYAVRINTAILTDLEEGTEYVYIVGDGTNMSEIKTFTTTRKGADVNFFVLGDTQSADTANVEAIFNALASSDVDYSFGIQTGDAIDNAGAYSYWDGIGKVFSGDFIGETPVVHVFGNHEYTGDLTGIHASHYFNVTGETDDESPVAYSVQYGNVYVAVINYATSDVYRKAAEWLVEDANASTANWKVLAMHQSAYFTNVAGSSESVRTIISEAVDAADIDFVFSGHDHSYARTYPVTAGVQDKNGAVYYICAATSPEKGYQITEVEGVHAIATDEYNAVYLTVNVTDTTFAVTTWDYTEVTTTETVVNEETGEEEVITTVTPTHSIIDTYTATKEITCSDNGHVNKFDGEYLTCKVCGYTQPVGTYTGLVTSSVSGNAMYLINGTPITGWFSYGEDNYLFDENGEAVTGTVEHEGYTYEFGEDGKLTQGAFVKNSDGTYSYYINGTAQRGWFEIDGNWYYFSRTNGFKTLSGEKTVEGMMYTFASDGKLIKGAFNETSNGTTYYWGPNPVTGLIEIDGETYYFNPENTYMVVNDSVEIDGEIYAFDDEGKFTHYGEHVDADGDGDCDECPQESFFSRFLNMILNFFKRIQKFFIDLFS